MKTHHIKTFAAASTFVLSGLAQAVGIAGGYSQNFDALGTAGTTLPSGWTAWSITTGANSHTQWVSSIPGTDVGAGTSQTIASALLDSGITTSIKGVRPYNIADVATPNDRVLSTSPSGNDGVALQLSLTNDSSAAIQNLLVSYDIVKFYDGTAQPTQNSDLPLGEELPGYQLFYSVNGGAWTNVASLNPVSTADGIHPVIPTGTVSASGVSGPADYTVTSIQNAALNLGTVWQVGQTLNLRWVDDNAVNISPDQVIGLNNVTLAAAVPEPESYALAMLGFGLLAFMGRSRKK